MISIHALLAESDGAGLSSCFGRIIFLSTLSLRRATKKPWTTCEILPISIHALLAESDRIRRNFYPRSPCGERPTAIRVPVRRFLFLSTLSLRRATLPRCQMLSTQAISIHALLAESDELLQAAAAHPVDFYPRSPCGERQLGSYSSVTHDIFLSTLSLRRATPLFFLPPPFPDISIHALLAESDAYIMTTIICIVLFLSTLSLRRATSFSLSAPPAHDNFYPRSPCGERQRPSWACRICRNFYPRSPCGERPADFRFDFIC